MAEHHRETFETVVGWCGQQSLTRQILPWYQYVMSTMTIDCGPELAVALGRRESELDKELRMASALKLFELGRISSGLGARLAGISRVEFLLTCGQYGVPVFQQTETELQADMHSVLE